MDIEPHNQAHALHKHGYLSLNAPAFYDSHTENYPGTKG